MRVERAPEGGRDCRRLLAPGDPEAERRRRAVEGQALPSQPCNEHREQRPGRGLAGPPHRPARELRYEGKERKRRERAQHGPGYEREVAARVLPGQRRPAGREQREDEREPERDVREREEGHGECEREARAREREPDRRRDRGEPDRPPGRVEGQRRGDPARPGRRGQGGQHAALGGRDHELPRRGSVNRLHLRRALAVLPAELGRELGGGRAPLGIRVECPVDRVQERRGRSGRTVSSGGAPARMRLVVPAALLERKGCLPASASQSTTPTAQTSAASVACLPSRRSGET